MHLMYHIDEKTGNRVYTLKKVDPNQQATVSAHPARFSPDDKFSKQRINVNEGLISANTAAKGWVLNRSVGKCSIRVYFTCYLPVSLV